MIPLRSDGRLLSSTLLRRKHLILSDNAHEESRFEYAIVPRFRHFTRLTDHYIIFCENNYGKVVFLSGTP